MAISYVFYVNKTVEKICITRRLRRIPNAWRFRFALNLVFTAQWFR
ncbi:TPA: hypothetical protein I7167_22065 [Vibrio vulnificus]|nr:hypothetical protein [Vibrio vulnificus]